MTIELINKLKALQSNYSSRDKAVEAYHTVLEDYENITFKSEVDQQQFKRDFSNLKQSVLILDKGIFSQKFAASMLAIIRFLEKGHY